jgi:hypothetical protein
MMTKAQTLTKRLDICHCEGHHEDAAVWKADIFSIFAARPNDMT